MYNFPVFKCFAMQVFELSAGTLLSYKSNLHSRNITAIMFFSQLKYLVTAAKDGTSKLCLVYTAVH